MSKPLFHVWYAYKSGLGIEIARVAPLLKRLLASHQVVVATYHAHVYNPSLLGTYRLSEHLTPHVPDDFSGQGICLFSRPRDRGPHRCDPLHAWAEQHGWPCVDESLGYNRLNVYAAAELLAAKHCFSGPTAVASILRRGSRQSTVMLNVLGGAALEKGFRSADEIRGWVTRLADATPDVRFVIPILPYQKRRFELAGNWHPSVRVQEFSADSYELTELLTGSRAVVTVEGGPLHLAVEAGQPVLVLAETTWMRDVDDVLPPPDRYTWLPVDLCRPDAEAVAHGVADWLARLPQP